MGPEEKEEVTQFNAQSREDLPPTLALDGGGKREGSTRVVEGA